MKMEKRSWNFIPSIKAISELECHQYSHSKSLWIKGKEILYFLKNVDPVNNLCIRTIFLHELVHFWQDYNNAFSNSTDSEKVQFTYKEQQATQLEHIYRAQQYELYKKKNGKYYKPKCCKEIAFGRCINDPGWIDRFIIKNTE